MAQPAGRGRPPAASRELLQEAALELFVENGYARTTVEEITTRAGVSRGTFFNYFAAKSDVFWMEVDDSLPPLEHALGETAERDPAPMATVQQALLRFGRAFGPTRVPFALTQHEVIGSTNELQASAVARFTRLSSAVRRYLRAHDYPALEAQAAAYAVVGAVLAAAQDWAAAGVGRGELEPYLQRALHPALHGFSG